MDILIILLLTLINAFFSIAEIALVTVKKSRIELLADKGNKNANYILRLTSNPEVFLSSVQVGITLIGIITGVYGGATLGDKATALFTEWGISIKYASALSLTLVIGGITYLSIVIGELAPKTIALHNAEKSALFCAPIIHYFTLAIYPFVKLLSWTTDIIMKLLRIRKTNDEIMSEEELLIMLRKARTQGVLEQEEGLVHENLFVFNDLKAQSLMTHYSEVEWIDNDMSKEEIIQLVATSKHSKFPVATKEIDNLKGYTTAGDLWQNLSRPDFQLTEIVRPPVFLAENADAFDIIDIFRKQKTHFGFVLDEFGAIRGIITLYDLMSALFGNLPDENDESEEPQIIKKTNGFYLVDAHIQIFEFNKYFHKELLHFNPHYTTLAGFLLYKLQDLPKEGQVIRHENMVFEVIDMDKVRIDKVLLKFKKESSHKNQL